MRIGVFGNTNSYPLLLTMALRQLGHEAVIAINRKALLHRPEGKLACFQKGYPHWVMDCSAIAEEDFVVGHPRIEEVLNFIADGSDALILNDIGPSLSAFCPVPALALLTGSDVTYYADPDMPAKRQLGADPAWVASAGARFVKRQWDAFVARQRDGIRNAVAVSAPWPGLVPAIDRTLDELGVTAERRDFVYIADTEPRTTAPRSPGRLRIVNGARLNWKRPLPDGFSSQDHKGTDLLLHGFAEFVAKGYEAELSLFRKGLHVAETEHLARDLGVEQFIRWYPEVSPEVFSAILSDADVVCDQFGDSFPGMVALDAMAFGIPVVANFGEALIGRVFRGAVPACQAATASEIAAHLTDLASRPDRRAEIGATAQAFARAVLSPRANAEKCLRLLAAAA